MRSRPENAPGSLKNWRVTPGLSEEFIEQSNLRIKASRFFKELLRDERRTVGRLDSRLTGIDRNAAGETIEYDPIAYQYHRSLHGGLL